MTTLSDSQTLPHPASFQADEDARTQALDVTRSFLVKAPAGSGKTELLTSRFLALLSEVEEPEQILAITFTRLATAEMRTRVLTALEQAEPFLASPGCPPEHEPARNALAHAQRRGWSLLQQPHRLNIQTIDSLCLRIAQEAPLLSRLGGQLQPVDRAEPMYAVAARRTIEQLGGANAPLSEALEHLLRLRDVNMADCEKLISGMLANRDQWLSEFSSAHRLTESEWTELRERREAPFQRERARAFHKVHALLSADHTRRLLDLAAYACSNQAPESIRGLANLNAIEDLDHLECVRQFLLTKDNEWRKQVDKNLGFPTQKNGGSPEQIKALKDLVEDLKQIPGLREALTSIEKLPGACYSDTEWQTIRSIFTVLLHAAAQLRVVFAENAAIDFVETGITAAQALTDSEIRSRWSHSIHHLLVDEFQDTSRRQYTLLRQIVSGWDPGEGCTCFLVGDPMQSIYLFRHAELALFEEIHQHHFGPHVDAVRFFPLTLERNFRSTAGIVEPLNELFSSNHGGRSSPHFSPAQSNPGSSAEPAVHLHTCFCGGPDLGGASKEAAAEQQAIDAVTIIQQHLPLLAQARAQAATYRVGVLARTRKHVALLTSLLREAGIPFRAIEIETLRQRQEILDLLALLRALLHPLDRVAWLAVLRAPWCGLSLADLHLLSGADDQHLQKRPLRLLLAERLPLLSTGGQQRAARVAATMEAALDTRFCGRFAASPNGFAAWLEHTWTTLGGPSCINGAALENINAFFQLLSSFKPAAQNASGNELDQQLEQLFAQPDPRAADKTSIQVMTIHKAKGLGFNAVLVPHLEKGGGSDSEPLLQWMTRTVPGHAQGELLIAPIGAKGGEKSPTYRWIRNLRAEDEQREVERLLYVACTRARTELHLFATVDLKVLPNAANGPADLSNPKADSLLHYAWPYLEPRIRQQYASRQQNGTMSATNPTSPGPFLIQPSQPPILFDLAAAAAPPTQTIHRLPAEWSPPASLPFPERPALFSTPRPQDQPLIRTGSSASRARGIVLHTLFEAISGLPENDPRRHLSHSRSHWQAVAQAMLRNAGLGRRELEAELGSVVSMLETAAADPHAQWILAQRGYAPSESEWTVPVDGKVRTLRADRVFLAGAEPLSEGSNYLWIVDYKTASGDAAGPFLLEERQRYEAQLTQYAKVLCQATGIRLPVRLALYYPALPHLLWWTASPC